MAQQPRLEPGDLTEDELRDIVEKVRERLWPRGQSPDEVQWTPDIVDSIASTLDDYGLRPADLMAKHENWRTQVILHGIRWANNILTEVLGNHADVLSEGARVLLKDAVQKLGEAQHEVRFAQDESPGPSLVPADGGDEG